MAGHSNGLILNIKRQKRMLKGQKQKLGRQITVAVKEGDDRVNFRLRLAIDAARGQHAQ